MKETTFYIGKKLEMQLILEKWTTEKKSILFLEEIGQGKQQFC